MTSGAEIIRQNRKVVSSDDEAVISSHSIVRADAHEVAVESAEDCTLEIALRPKALEDYVGQSAIKQVLSLSLQAARQRQEPVDHVLFYGPPGLGKTTLAMIIAEEMGVPMVMTAAPALERPRDIVGFLMTLQPKSVLFIDEIHRLNKVTEEILYSAMEDFVLTTVAGKGPSAKTIQVPLVPFTLVGATTKAGSLSGPLRDRFGLIQRLNYYSPEELQGIIYTNSKRLSFTLTESAALALAKRSRGTPRIANRLLRRVRDYAQVHTASQINDTQVLEALAAFDIDELGLDVADRRLLATMASRFGGGPVGLEAMASAIGEDARTIEDVVEPYLMQCGLIQRTPRGRMLTPYALQVLGAEGQLGLQPSLFE